MENLIYANEEKEDIGVLDIYNLDLAYGADENNFEIQMPLYEHKCKENYFLYIEDSEYGGIIDTISVNTETEVVSYAGRTWHGILESKIIVPDIGEDYFIVSGDANEVMAALITRLGLGELMSANAESSGIYITEYKFRYIDGYKGIASMLAEYGAKLKIIWHEGKAVLSAYPIVNYSENEEWDSDLVNFVIDKVYNKINHLICLGKGELSERLVINLYSDAAGNISTTQTFFDSKEIVSVYEQTNEADADKLTESGIKKFKTLRDLDKVEISFDATDETYDIGDIVGATEQTTGIFIAKAITKKVVKTQQGLTVVEYEVGGND